MGLDEFFYHHYIWDLWILVKYQGYSMDYQAYPFCRLREGGWDKSPSLSIVFGLSSKTQWLSGLYYADFISFYSLLNCAEVGRRNRILTNYRFLSHSLFLKPILPEIEYFHAIIKTSDVKERIWFYQRNGHVM